MQTSSKALISPVACVLQTAQSYRLRCASYVCMAGSGKLCAHGEDHKKHSLHAAARTCSEASVRALERLRLPALC